MNLKSSLNKSHKAKRRTIYFVLFFLLFDLLFLYLNKYSRKGLSILEFQLSAIGNLINLIFTLIPVIALIILFFNNQRFEKSKIAFYLFLTVLMSIPLLFTATLKELPLGIQNFYLLGYSFEKIFIAILFLTYQFVLIYLASYSWLLIFNTKSKIYFRSFFYSIICIFLLVFFAAFYNNYDDTVVDRLNPENKSDVAVILGAAVWSKTKASPLFASRIAKASNLYNANVVKKIQVTGGSAPGELSEAEVAFNYLVKYGVNAHDIWIEKKTSSTSEQVLFIKENLVNEKKMKNILIVSDKFHLKRVMEICKFYKIKADGVSSDLKLRWDKVLFYRFRDSLALLLFWLFGI